MKKIIILMIFAVMIFSANSCSKAKKEWKNTIAKNSIRDYVEYRKKYPNSTYADSVKHRIWKKTLAIDSIQAFEYFIDKYRVGAYVDSAKNRVKDLMVTQGKYISVVVTANLNEIASGKVTEMYYEGTLVLRKTDGKEIEALCPISLAKNVKTGQILEVEYDKRLKKYKVIEIIADTKHGSVVGFGQTMSGLVQSYITVKLSGGSEVRAWLPMDDDIWTEMQQFVRWRSSSMKKLVEIKHERSKKYWEFVKVLKTE